MPTGYRPNSPLPSGGQTNGGGGVIYTGNVTVGSLTPGAVSGTPAANTMYAENVPKGWVKANLNGSIIDSFNVSGVTDVGTGLLTVTWDRDFANANYMVQATVASNNLVVPQVYANGTTAVGSVALISVLHDNTTADPDGTNPFWHVLAFGDQ